MNQKRDSAKQLSASPSDTSRPTIAVAEWGGVFLESGAGKSVLCILPTTNVDALEFIPTTPEVGDFVETVVVINDPAVGGSLWTSEVKDRLGLTKAIFYATDLEAPIDRGVTRARKPRKGNQLPKQLRKRNLLLRRFGPGIVEVWWSNLGEEFHALVGAGIPIDAFYEVSQLQLVLGSIALPEGGDVDFPACGSASNPQEIILFRSVPPGTADRVYKLWSNTDVAITVVDPQKKKPVWVASTLELVAALSQDAPAKVRMLLQAMTAEEVEMALISLAAQGETGAGRQLAELALDIHGSRGSLWFQCGVLEFLDGEPEMAEQSYRKALKAEEPQAIAACHLSTLLLEQGNLEEAQHMSERALEALPQNQHSLQAALTTRALSGNRDGALQLLAERGHLLGREVKRALEEMLSSDRMTADITPARPVHRFPLHARLMLETGRGLVAEGRLEDALPSLRRAHELDPANLEAAADLGIALAELNCDAEAIALYDEAIGTALGGQLLHFNRGNALHRLGRYEEALDDYEACCELVPEWLDPRFNLIATLHALEEKEEAVRQLEVLERQGASAQMVQTLREKLGA